MEWNCSPHTLLVEMQNNSAAVENTMASFFKNVYKITTWPAISLLGRCSKELKTKALVGIVGTVVRNFLAAPTSNIRVLEFESGLRSQVQHLIMCTFWGCRRWLRQLETMCKTWMCSGFLASVLATDVVAISRGNRQMRVLSLYVCVYILLSLFSN